MGLGLMGGSMGMALRERRLAREVTGFDRDEETLRLAREKGAVDESFASPGEAVKGAGLIVLAVPVKHCSELLLRCREHISPGAVVTDLGSTKEYLVKEIKENLPPGVHYTGGHPMTGSDEWGIRAAEPTLWENAIYVLTPSADTPDKAVEGLKKIITGIGAQVLLMSPANHDRLVALVSHLPHLVAVALVSMAAKGERKEMVQTLAAGGFRDTTRVAMGNPEIWRDICVTNREAIDFFMSSYIKELEQLRQVIRDNNESELERILEFASEYRKEIPHRGRSILPEVFEVVALVKDTPGTIGRIATLLGDKGLNISSIEILHVREEEGGSIKLGFRDRPGQEQAVEVLRKHGYRAHKR